MVAEAKFSKQSQSGVGRPWLMVGIASLANFALYVIIFGAPPVIPVMVAETGITHQQAGLLMTVTLAAYCVCSLLGGFLSDRFGARPVLTLGLLLASAAGFFFALTDNFVVMVVLRTLVGVGAACVFAPGLRFLLATLPREISGRAMGWYMIAINTGVAAPMMITPLVMVNYGWRLPLELYGLAGGLVAGLFWWVAREARPGSPGSESAPPAAAGAAQPFLSLALVLVALASLMRMSQTYGVVTWTPAYLMETLQFSAPEIALATAVLSLSNVPALLFAGWLSDRTERKVLLAIVGLAISALGVVLAWVHSAPVWFITAVMFATGFGTGISSVPIFALPAMTVSRSHVGRATGFASTFTFAGPILTAYLGGLIKTSTGEYDLAFLVFGLAPAAGIVVLLPLLKGFKPRW